MPDAAKKRSQKSLVAEYVRLYRPAEISAQTLAELRQFVLQGLGPGTKVSDRYLLDLLEAAPIPIARELGGLPMDLRGRVHFHDFGAAETSLRGLQEEFQTARALADRQREADCRRAVLKAKERLELILRRSSLRAEKRAEKQEMREWFRVWLETPELFGAWLDLRKRALGQVQERNRGPD